MTGAEGLETLPPEVHGEQREHLVTRGTYTLDSGDPLLPVGTVGVTIPTFGSLWEADGASRLRLEITTSTDRSSSRA